MSLGCSGLLLVQHHLHWHLQHPALCLSGAVILALCSGVTLGRGGDTQHSYNSLGESEERQTLTLLSVSRDSTQGRLELCQV